MAEITVVVSIFGYKLQKRTLANLCGKLIPLEALGPCMRGFAASVLVGMSSELELKSGRRMPEPSVLWGHSPPGKPNQRIRVHIPSSVLKQEMTGSAWWCAGAEVLM